jgi:ribosome hibernation promoting factor
MKSGPAGTGCRGRDRIDERQHVNLQEDETMQVNLSGHHVEITPPLRSYVEKKIARVLRHCDRVIDVQCTLTVEKLRHGAESTIRLSGAAVHAAVVQDDMYAAIDLLADKLDEQVRRHKEKHRDPQAARHRHGTAPSP